MSPMTKQLNSVTRRSRAGTRQDAAGRQEAEIVKRVVEGLLPCEPGPFSAPASARATRRQLSSIVISMGVPSVAFRRYFASHICLEIGAMRSTADNLTVSMFMSMGLFSSWRVLGTAFSPPPRRAAATTGKGGAAQAAAGVLATYTLCTAISGHPNMTTFLVQVSRAVLPAAAETLAPDLPAPWIVTDTASGFAGSNQSRTIALNGSFTSAVFLASDPSTPASLTLNQTGGAGRRCRAAIRSPRP